LALTSTGVAAWRLLFGISGITAALLFPLPDQGRRYADFNAAAFTLKEQ
jgi:hypothetical protein